LILNALHSHLRCVNAACYQFNPQTKEYDLLISSGKFPKRTSELITHSEASPLLVHQSGPGAPALRAPLTDLGLGSAILVPILRPNIQMMLFAGRDVNEQPFLESDVEMFQILARQAVVALENSRLYEEQLEYVRKVEESQKALLQAEKMAAAGRLSASIAHEVNNPLQAVQNCLHLATRDDVPEEKRREYLGMARAELERLMLTTRRMLDFYRPNTNALEKVDIRDMLEYIINLMNKQFSESNLKIEIDISEKLPTVMAVSSQIQQVFINLSLNAADAMPEGGVLKITARPSANGVELLFRDNGPGIPREKQQNIFEPFFSTKDGGTGLGLTVSYNIITAHGGTLEYVADRVSGACFRIILPGGEQ
jgi:two-component system, NtrC family, sensor kinase